MALYQVIVNEVVVWEKRINSNSVKAFPDEYRGRPESGERVLKLDGEIIATMRTRDADDLARIAAEENG